MEIKRAVLTLPTWEKTAAAVTQTVADLIAYSKSKTAEIQAQTAATATFANTVEALDDLEYAESAAISRIHLLQNVSTDPDLRQAAHEATIEFQNYAIERAYDGKLYAALKAYLQKSQGKHHGEEAKLLEEIVSDYRRMGMDLSDDKQDEVKALQKELSTLETNFSQNINEYEDSVSFTKEELKGLDDDVLSHLTRDPDGEYPGGKYKVTLQYPEYLPVMEFCELESTRRKLWDRKQQVAHPSNTTILNQMIELRTKIAHLLGYASWNHYVLEDRMAKNPERVWQFLEDFEVRLKKKSKAELTELIELKRKHTGDPKTTIQIWDYPYYSALLKKQNFAVDTQALKEFFPLENVLQGMLKFVAQLFQIQMDEMPEGSFESWHPEVRLFKITEKAGKSSEPVGYFFLDLYPRSGKYGHAAVFDVSPGKLQSDGTYQRPVAAMLCNFSKAGGSFLSHSEVETLFHEFGHILHHVLTKARFARFSGTSVAWDFVEAPSQIMENWCWDPTILNQLTPAGKQIDPALVERMNLARKAGMGMFYLRQLSFAKADLSLHGGKAEAAAAEDVNSVMRKVSAETFLPYPAEANPAAGFGHLVGYASGYYGYSWADVMAADMFSLFKARGLLDAETGLALKKEVFEQGSSRDENASLEKFLGRPLSTDAFFLDLGLEAA